MVLFIWYGRVLYWRSETANRFVIWIIISIYGSNTLVNLAASKLSLKG